MACVSLMKDLVKAKPENPIEFTLVRLRTLQQELENDGSDVDADMTNEMSSAATKIQAVQRGKIARKGLPNIETRLLSWSEE
jgi:hypothetical protein